MSTSPTPQATITTPEGPLTIGQGHPPLFIIGPDSLESLELALEIATTVKELSTRLNVPVIFKGSYDKANRTSPDSYRGPGMEKGLEILTRVQKETGLGVTSDVHTPAETLQAGEVLDLIQIPAFLCRQNDLLAAAGKTGKAVNIKKGQFLSPHQVAGRMDAARGEDTPGLMITERGSFFGYGDLVNDFRTPPRLRAEGIPIIFDATHSVQRPGQLGDRSGGERELIPFLAKAAAGVGCDGFFLEVHPDPDQALCDGPSSLRLKDLEGLLKQLIALDAISRSD